MEPTESADLVSGPHSFAFESPATETPAPRTRTSTPTRSSWGS